MQFFEEEIKQLKTSNPILVSIWVITIFGSVLLCWGLAYGSMAIQAVYMQRRILNLYLIASPTASKHSDLGRGSLGPPIINCVKLVKITQSYF